MALRDEIVQYFDGNGLVCPGPQPVGGGKGSDNGPMYTSEYYVMLKMSNQINDSDIADFGQKIGQCVNHDGMLCRVPIGQHDGQEQVDDYYGVLNGCVKLGNTEIPRKFVLAMIRFFGFMDNENPGKIDFNSWMLRQPQLMACMASAAFPSWLNPLHILLRSLVAPAYWYAAIVIALSCMGTDPSNTDARRLAWHLIGATENKSLLCWIASKIWLKRLYKDYGADGMKAVAAIYYQPKGAGANPFAKYWVTE